MKHQSIVSALFKNAALHPNKIALIIGTEPNITRVTYSELTHKILQSAKFLSDNGASRGQFVILSATQSTEFIACYFALHLIGAIAVPVDPQLPSSKLQDIANQCSSKIAILSKFTEIKNTITVLLLSSFTENDGDEINLLKFPEPSEKADLLFTTGTTGMPKGVILTHQNVLAGAKNINHFIQNTSQDIELIPLPFNHSFGLARLRCNVLLGATIVLANGFLLPGRIYRQLEETKSTGFCSVPAGIAVLFKFGEDKLAQFKHQLKYIEIGSAPMSLEHKLKLMDLLPDTRICMHYGLTEASRSTFIEFHKDKDFLDSIGKSTPGVQLEIRNNLARECLIDESGTINVKGDSVAKEYLSSGNIVSKSGWLDTGDSGFLNSQGYIFLSGRSSDMINIGGQKVAPLEIENLLNLLPWVRDCACIGVPDPNNISGEVVKIYLVKNKKILDTKNISDSDVILYLRDKVESYKIPSQIEWIDRIPKTKSGKTQRHLLRQVHKEKNGGVNA